MGQSSYELVTRCQKAVLSGELHIRPNFTLVLSMGHQKDALMIKL